MRKCQGKKFYFVNILILMNLAGCTLFSGGKTHFSGLTKSTTEMTEEVSNNSVMQGVKGSDWSEYFDNSERNRVLIADNFNEVEPQIGKWLKPGFVAGNPNGGESFLQEKGRPSFDDSLFVYGLSKQGDSREKYTSRTQMLSFEKTSKLYVSFWISVSSDGVFPYAIEKDAFPERLSVKLFWLDLKDQNFKEGSVFFGFSGRQGVMGSNNSKEKSIWFETDFFEYDQWYYFSFFFDFEAKHYVMRVEDLSKKVLFEKHVKGAFTTIDFMESFQFIGWSDYGQSQFKPTLKFDNLLLMSGGAPKQASWVR